MSDFVPHHEAESENPWLEIPLEDYESHMAAPSVEQTAMLAETLGSLLRAHHPGSLALLGSAGGNGLEQVDPLVTKKVVIVDLNADYLTVCARRFRHKFEHFESVLCDLSTRPPLDEPVEFVYAGLVLEYLNQTFFLSYAPSLISSGGRIAFVFQNAASQGPVTDTGIASIRRLEAVHASVDVNEVVTTLSSNGMWVVDRRALATVPGKQFTLLVLEKLS